MEMLFNRSTALEFLKRKQKPKCKSDQKKTRKMAESKKEQKMQLAFATERKEKKIVFYEIITTAVIKRNTQQSLPNM